MNHKAVAQRYIQSGRLTLTDPAFNLREFTKQLLLLEDHLVQPTKRCYDCIRKHFLTAEALAEEATALDKGKVWGDGPAILAAMVRKWSEFVLDGKDLVGIAQSIRTVRKELTPLVFDPRSVATPARVASLHIVRSRGGCPYHS